MSLKARAILYATALCIGLLVLWFARRRHDQRVDQAIHSTVLPPEDSARLIVDEVHHNIITITRRGTTGGQVTTATFLPRSGASVDIRHGGSVVVTARKSGTEVSPFLGVSLGSDIRGRAALGLNLFFIRRWEIGGGLLMGSDIHDTRLFVGGTYNAYGNMIVGLGIDNKKTAHLIVGLKF